MAHSKHLRASPRVAMGDTHVACTRSDDSEVAARVLDISTGGALLAGPLPLSLGERFDLHLGDLEMRACALRRVGDHVGVQFEEISPLAFAAIERRVNDAIRLLGDVELPDAKGCGLRRVPAHLLQMQSVYETLAVSPSFSVQALERVGEAAFARAKKTATPLALAELEQLRRVWLEPDARLDHDARFGLLTVKRAAADKSATRLPETIGRYRIIEHRATGGAADIFVGIEPSPVRARPVVIKRILPHFATNPAYLEVFVDEARWMSRVQHPNVVQVYEMGEQVVDDINDASSAQSARPGARVPFLALEYVPGFSLRHLLVEASRSKKFLPMEACLVAVAQACAGLHAVHELDDVDGTPASLVHRDVSPQNLMATMEGEVKLLDFGMAKPTAALGDLFEAAGATVIKGGARYLAPEQIRGEPLDRRCDVFALGVVAWELFAERRLFRRASDFSVMESILKGDRPALRKIRPEVPAEVDDVITRALCVNRAERTPTAAQFRSELLEAAANAGLRTDRFTLSELMESFFGDKHHEATSTLSERIAAATLSARDENVKIADTLRGVRGSLADMSLAEIMQSIDQGNRSAEIQISIDGVAVGSIGIRERTVVSAAFGDLRGAPAYIAAMSLKEGQFLIRHQEPRAALFNLEVNAEWLMLDALRAIDENSAPAFALDPLPKAWTLDAVLEDGIQIAARIHEAARHSELEAEMSAARAESAQHEIEALTKAKRDADARIATLEADLVDARAQLAALTKGTRKRKR